MTGKTSSPGAQGSAARRIVARFIALILLVFLLNLLAAHLMSDCGLPAVLRVDSCSDDIVRVGWPVKFYEAGGIAAHSFFSASNLAADILAGFAAALLVSIGSHFLRRSG